MKQLFLDGVIGYTGRSVLTDRGRETLKTMAAIIAGIAAVLLALIVRG